MTDYRQQCKCDETQCMAGTGCDPCNPQFYMGNVTYCATPAEFETAMQNAIAAQSNARAEDFEAFASKVFIGDYPAIHKRCASAAWQARQPEIDALKARIKELEENPSYSRLRFQDMKNLWNDAEDRVDALKAKLDRAERTLTCAGFQDLGGEFWKPPLGKPELLVAEKEKVHALIVESHGVQQMLARALGDGNGITVGDCRDIGGTEDDVCTYDHTLVTLAELVAERIKILDENLDSSCQTSQAMGKRLWQQEARIKELEAQTQWQPIETAPKGFRIVLANSAWPTSAEGGWHEGLGTRKEFLKDYTGNPSFGSHLPRCDYWGYGPLNATPFNKNFQPSHWMPLPTPPKGDE